MCRPAVYPERRSGTRRSSCPGRAQGVCPQLPGPEAGETAAKTRRAGRASGGRRVTKADTRLSRHFCHPERSSGYWHKSVLEHEIPRAPALGDALGLVEGPVDTEVDAALAVLFLGLGERREAT